MNKHASLLGDSMIDLISSLPQSIEDWTRH